MEEGGREGDMEHQNQYSHLKHLSVSHLKKIWTGFLKPSGRKKERKKERTLFGVRSFTAAWLWLVRGVSRACDPAPVDKLIYCILLRAPWGGREEQHRRFAASCSTSESFYLSSWAFFLNESEMLDCLLLRDLFWMGEGIFKDYDDIWLRCLGLFEAPCQASCLQVHIGTNLGLTPERKHM